MSLREQFVWANLHQVVTEYCYLVYIAVPQHWLSQTGHKPNIISLDTHAKGGEVSSRTVSKCLHSWLISLMRSLSLVSDLLSTISISHSITFAYAIWCKLICSDPSTSAQYSNMNNRFLISVAISALIKVHTIHLVCLCKPVNSALATVVYFM